MDIWLVKILLVCSAVFCLLGGCFIGYSIGTNIASGSGMAAGAVMTIIGVVSTITLYFELMGP